MERMERKDDQPNIEGSSSADQGKRARDLTTYARGDLRMPPGKTMKGLSTACGFMMKHSLLKVMAAAPGMMNLPFAFG